MNKEEEEEEDNNNDDEEEKEGDDNKNKEEEDNKNNKDKGLLTIYCIVAWVTRPEQPKGAKEKVKETQRAAN